MPLKAYHVSIALEVLLKAIDYSTTYKKEEIENEDDKKLLLKSIKKLKSYAN